MSHASARERPWEGFEPDPTSERILDAARARLEMFGVRRLTIEDVARVADVSRVTVYRKFGSKDALIQAVLVREAGLFFAELEAAIGGMDTARERLTESFAIALDHLKQHSLLNRLLEIEPEAILPYFTTAGGPLLAAARTYLAEQLGRNVSEGRLPRLEEIDVVAELLARVVLSFFLMPESAASLDTPERARDFARRYLGPIVERRSGGPVPEVAH
jgi:AcrR family transcriptional regulator